MSNAQVIALTGVVNLLGVRFRLRKHRNWLRRSRRQHRVFRGAPHRL